jgi:hypothetical protein
MHAPIYPEDFPADRRGSSISSAGGSISSAASTTAKSVKGALHWCAKRLQEHDEKNRVDRPEKSTIKSESLDGQQRKNQFW